VAVEIEAYSAVLVLREAPYPASTLRSEHDGPEAESDAQSELIG